MPKADLIGDVVAIIVGVMLSAVVLFITFVEQIDNWVQKWRKKRAQAAVGL